jgi:hypothetical protein
MHVEHLDGKNDRTRQIRASFIESRKRSMVSDIQPPHYGFLIMDE